MVAVHPHSDLWLRLRPDEYQPHISKLEMDLPAFNQAITTANEARVAEYEGRIGADEDLPDLVTNANELRDYYTEVGAYNEGEPTPAQPPPPCGLAVPNQGDNPGPMRDCMPLLALKDTLRGTATLNWSMEHPIGRWDGVIVSGTPSRITKLELPNGSLSGSILTGLWNLFELTHLDLSRNSLTGETPHELGWLNNPESLKLSGNNLTGCIPVALESVATNDLSSLNLLYCQPPAPEDLAGTAGESSIALNWSAVSNISRYRVEYRLGGAGHWSSDSDTLTGISHTVSGLDCGNEYQFRVSAYGSGTHYAAEWSEPSLELTETTGKCSDTRAQDKP